MTAFFLVILFSLREYKTTVPLLPYPLFKVMPHNEDLSKIARLFIHFLFFHIRF